MKAIQIYDKAMCCSTGVCGPQVDPVLPQFASDLEWLRAQGVSVERFNLGQQPQAFVDNRNVNTLLTNKGVECLPLIVVDGEVMSQGVYPSRESLAKWSRIAAVPIPQLTISGASGCCGDSGCC